MISGACTPPSVAIVAIVKDEVEGLLEWIAYYRVLGAARLILYDNGSTDGTTALLQRLHAAGILTHRPWPSAAASAALPWSSMMQAMAAIPDPRAIDWTQAMALGPQAAAYNHAVIGCEGQVDWMCFLDADEFLLPRNGRTLPQFAAFFGADIGAVAVNWVYFGSNGQIAPDGRLTLERFTRRAPRVFSGHVHMKTMARPACIDRMHIHAPTLRRGLFVDDRGVPLQIEHHAFTPAISHARAQVNHYSVKSKAEFARKMRRGLAVYADTHPDKFEDLDQTYFARQDLNDEADTEILHWGPQVKAEMRRLQTL